MVGGSGGGCSIYFTQRVYTSFYTSKDSVASLKIFTVDVLHSIVKFLIVLHPILLWLVKTRLWFATQLKHEMTNYEGLGIFVKFEALHR